MPQNRFIITVLLSLVFVILSNFRVSYLSVESLSFRQNVFNSNGSSTRNAGVTLDAEVKYNLSTDLNPNIETIFSQTPESETKRFEFLKGISPFYLGIIGSLLAGLTTGIGGLPVLFFSEVSERIQSILLGFAAGVMLAATSFSLLLPSIEAATSGGGSQIDAANIVVAGTLLGGVFLWVTHRYFPYKRYIKQPQGSNLENLKGIWLFVIAIAIHNFPDRIIPNSQNLGRGKEVTASLMVGFVVMMYLDISLG